MTKENNEEYDTEAAASKLVDLFIKHSFGIPEEGVRVSDEGLKLMQGYFGDVPVEERGYVFISFLAKLTEQDYSYDVLQFMDMEVEN